MLQTKNLTKIYKANGVEVKALDNVTLSFGDSGMCFILGKSGSGKSTLLNVCGGLDAPDSGEIIIKNRSSKDFSQKDFDSYRNTYVGFIFQEYNVLNEFSVEDNVMLALELQGKPRDKATVNQLLEMVEPQAQHSVWRTEATCSHCTCLGQESRNNHGGRTDRSIGFQYRQAGIRNVEEVVT